MSETLRTALLFLVGTLFNLYLFILVVRLILVWIKADYFHPVTQFVIKMTDFIIRPLRKILPNIKNFETATIVVIFLLELIKFFLIAIIGYGFPNLLGIPILAIADIIYLLIQTFTYAIILEVLLSFIQPMSPFMHLLMRFNSPVMHPLRRLIPPVGGFDLTPIFALIILQLLNIILVGPLMSIGQGMTFFY